MKKRFLEIYIPLSIVLGPILTLVFHVDIIVTFSISIAVIFIIHSLMIYQKKTKALKEGEKARGDENPMQ